MNIEFLSEALLDIVQDWDASTPPYGLYAAQDLSLAPELNEFKKQFFARIRDRPNRPDTNPFAMGISQVTRWSKPDGYTWSWTLGDGREVTLQFLTVSKIKVRKFGSSYHVDKHEHFLERWKKARLDHAISQLWASTAATAPLRMLLFVGYDTAVRPFEREIEALKPHLKRAAHDVNFASREWNDIYGRGFRVRASLWSHQKAPESP
jgi:hypothetical protein